MATKKFSMILLVVLVASQCTAASSMSDMINKVMDFVKGEIEKMESMAKNVEQEVQQEAQKMMGQVKEELQKVEQQLKDEMKTISETSAKVIPCITAERDNISSIYTNAEKQGQKCVLKAGLKIFPLLLKVNGTIQKAKQNVNEFIADLQKPECKGALIKCLTNEVPKIKQALQDRAKEVQAEVEQAKQALPQVIQILQQCVQTIVQDSTSEMKAIFTEVKNCILG